MQFNINEWVQKQAKLRELDFKSPEAFKAYKAKLKNKMHKKTKVTIGGKETTAGEAGGEKKEKPKAPFSMKKGSVDANTFEKMVPELKGTSTRLSDRDEADVLQAVLKSAGVYEKDNVTYEDAVKAVDNMSPDSLQAHIDKHQLADEGEEEEVAEEIKQNMKDNLKKLLDPEHPINKEFREGGGSIKVSWATGERIPRWADDGKGGFVGAETLPGYKPEQDNMSRRDAEEARDDEFIRISKDPYKLQDEVDRIKALKGKKGKDAAEPEMSDDEEMDNMSAGELWSQDPGEEYEYDTSTAEKAGFKFTGGNVDGFNGKDNYGEEGEAEIIDMADQVAKGKMKQSKMDKSLHPEDPRMSDQGRKKEYASQNYDESVTPRSTRIQEARMYKTIQELKALERGI